MESQTHATPYPHATPSPRDMQKHVSILGALHLIYNALGLLMAVGIFIFFTGTGLLSGEPEAMFITTGMGLAIASFMLVLSLPGLIGGFFLLQRRSWARILVLILGFFSLISFPFGTLLGLYTIWVLMNDDAIALFE